MRHAPNKVIIHRDIKPTNVLVTQDAVPCGTERLEGWAVCGHSAASSHGAVALLCDHCNGCAAGT
jgi:hypothetical protein